MGVSFSFLLSQRGSTFVWSALLSLGIVMGRLSSCERLFCCEQVLVARRLRVVNT